MTKPTTTISVKDAQYLRAEWMNTRAKNIKKAMGVEDVSDVTFKLDDLEAFLDYVKDESKKQGFKNTGIRVYFGAYKDKNDNKATVFLAPTKGAEGTSENNYDIAPFNNGTQGWPPNKY